MPGVGGDGYQSHAVVLLCLGGIATRLQQVGDFLGVAGADRLDQVAVKPGTCRGIELADDPAGERLDGGEAEQAGDENAEGAVFQHSGDTAAAAEHGGEEAADEEEELHTEAVNSGGEDAQQRSGARIADHPWVAGEGKRGVQQHAEEHGKGAQGVQVVPAARALVDEFASGIHVNPLSIVCSTVYCRPAQQRSSRARPEPVRCRSRPRRPASPFGR